MLNNLVGSVLTSLVSDNDPNTTTPMKLVVQLINQSGGVESLMNMLQQGGLGEALNSWVSNGANQAVSGNQLQDALGSTLGQAAANVGLNSNQAGDLLSQVLPQVINGLTPNGNAADANGFGMDDIARIALQQFLQK